MNNSIYFKEYTIVIDDDTKMLCAITKDKIKKISLYPESQTMQILINDRQTYMKKTELKNMNIKELNLKIFNKESFYLYCYMQKCPPCSRSRPIIESLASIIGLDIFQCERGTSYDVHKEVGADKVPFLVKFTNGKIEKTMQNSCIVSVLNFFKEDISDLNLLPKHWKMLM